MMNKSHNIPLIEMDLLSSRHVIKARDLSSKNGTIS